MQNEVKDKIIDNYIGLDHDENYIQPSMLQDKDHLSFSDSRIRRAIQPSEEGFNSKFLKINEIERENFPLKAETIKQIKPTTDPEKRSLFFKFEKEIHECKNSSKLSKLIVELLLPYENSDKDILQLHYGNNQKPHAKTLATLLLLAYAKLESKSIKGEDVTTQALSKNNGFIKALVLKF